MNLLEQSLWWLVPFILIILLMLHAMMEFTVSLLVKRPETKRNPIPARQLMERLLEENRNTQAYKLEKGEDSHLEIAWEAGELPRQRQRAISRGSSRSHIRLLFDESRAELRINLVAYSYFFFIGMAGWLPRVTGYASAVSGPPDAVMTSEISRIANRYGWSVRPVLWWFQATHRGFHFLEALTPPPLRRWPARRFWGILYPLSYFVGMIYLVWIAGGLDRNGIILVGGVSAAWWGLWGLLVWALTGFPVFRRK